MKIYFAHPVSHYNTDYESACIRILQQVWPEAEILNPNSDLHTENYRKGGMNYFKALVSECDMLAFSTFNDGEVGMGVFTEIMAMCDKNGRVFQVSDEGIGPMSLEDISAIRPLSILQTRERVKSKVL